MGVLDGQDLTGIGEQWHPRISVAQVHFANTVLPLTKRKISLISRIENVPGMVTRLTLQRFAMKQKSPSRLGHCQSQASPLMILLNSPDALECPNG